SPERATLALAPGGSFICPNTNVAIDSDKPSLFTLLKSHPPSSIECLKSSPYLITPDSIISLNKSFPSLVLSPTPSNTDKPECPLEMLLNNFIIRYVLPTQPTLNKLFIPPLKSVYIKTITLIPVKITTVKVDNFSNICDFLWLRIPSALVTSPIP